MSKGQLVDLQFLLKMLANLSYLKVKKALKEPVLNFRSIIELQVTRQLWVRICGLPILLAL